MRTPFIAGNWKMNTTKVEVESLLDSLKVSLSNVDGVKIAVCPPFPYLSIASDILNGTRIRLGAQNMHWEEKGAFTGEVAAMMIKDVGCQYVILGHSERRQYFNETDENVFKKIKQALRIGLNPIVCVGETLKDREAGDTENVINKQIQGCFKKLSSDEINKITIAYEPVWAIGTGKTATPEQAQEVHRFIRDWVQTAFNQGIASDICIQYGGSVKPGNAKELLSQADIDGALVGGASLKSEDFTAIIKASIS
jgi:triosephosphate isomerase